jgi:receptor protein-tyrosine kinase
MSKIERALRKAEEERRRKESLTPVMDERHEDAGADAAVEATGETAQRHKEPERTSEHFRKIAAKLNSYYESVGPVAIVFTSAVSGEGKTTSAVNVAVSLCQDFNLSVCLVDCDLRKPKLSSHFGSNGRPGIIEALRGEVGLDSVIRPTTLEGLSAVHSRKPETETLPLLNSERFRKLVADLRVRFDFVIFDSSPVLPVVDTVMLLKHVSGMVLVIESGKTRKKHIEQVFEQVGRDKMIGFIMNYKKHKMPETYNYAKHYDYGPDKQ